MTCGIHITRTDPCIHCARAHAAIHAELDAFLFAPATQGRKRTSTQTRKLIPEIERLRATGLKYSAIAAQLSCGTDFVVSVCRGRVQASAERAKLSPKPASRVTYAMPKDRTRPVPRNLPYQG
jgi:hypothetical protein